MLIIGFLIHIFLHPRLTQTWLNWQSIMDVHWSKHVGLIVPRSHTSLQPRLIQIPPIPHSMDRLHSSRQPRPGRTGMTGPIGMTGSVILTWHIRLQPCLTQTLLRPHSTELWHSSTHPGKPGPMGSIGKIVFSRLHKRLQPTLSQT